MIMPEYGHHLDASDAAARASLIYAVGDIHGSLDKLEKLIAACEQHAGGRPSTFIFLGDYIDRGPHSADVVRLIMAMQSAPGKSVIALKGNHEAVALEIIDGAGKLALWLELGGAETLASYGVIDVHDLPRDHVDWMRSLPASHDDGQRLFVHAGIDPQKPYDAQSEHDLLWIREPFLSDERDHGRLIVHGHTPRLTGAPDWRGNRLNVDTGAVFGGPLTAAVFTGEERDPIGFLQAG